MTFQFEKVYDHFAKPMDGEVLEYPFGPFMFMVDEPTSDTPKGKMLPRLITLALMASEDGNEKINELAAKLIANEDENFCVVLIHEGHVKKMKDPTPEQEIELKKRGLIKDPNAKHVASIRIFHKSGSVAGFCPLDAERRATYAQLERNEGLLQVNIGADQGYQH